MLEADNDDDLVVSHLAGIEYDDLAQRMGILIGQLHNTDIIHGDLTTSNILVVRTIASSSANVATPPIKNNGDCRHPLPSSEQDTNSNHTNNNQILKLWKLMLIDFGLGKSTTSVEEHAVDLDVLERALQSTHPKLPIDFMDRLLDQYAKTRIEVQSGDPILSCFVLFYVISFDFVLFYAMFC
jgi:TP53 regulating kinase and related kinases